MEIHGPARACPWHTHHPAGSMRHEGCASAVQAASVSVASGQNSGRCWCGWCVGRLDTLCLEETYVYIWCGIVMLAGRPVMVLGVEAMQ